MAHRVGVLQTHCTPGGHRAAGCAATPPFQRILIANRGEIACRVHRAAAALGVETVGICTEEDSQGLHPRVLGKTVRLAKGATPVAPYLDAGAIVDIAVKEQCQAVHPGYGFLSESTEFAALCERRGIRFIGPRPETIDLFGDKTKAKAAAVRAGLAVLQGSPAVCHAAAALGSVREHKLRFPLLLKAAFGGGGRGQAVVAAEGDFEQAFTRCSKEAEMSFGHPEVFVERFLQNARHIEVQILGDGSRCVHLFERDCSVQLRKQKVVEFAPCAQMAPQLRERICAAATHLCESVGYLNAGTVEFLVDGDVRSPDAQFFFLELNPRIQVEHTVTEEVTGTDLVGMQLRIASGASFSDLGLSQSAVRMQGCAMQIRVGLAPGGGGAVTDYRAPAGVRVDSSIARGTVAVTDYDPMVAKLIVSGPTFAQTLSRGVAALKEFTAEGLRLNKDFLFRILQHPELPSGVHTTWVEDRGLHLAPRKAPAAGAAGSLLEVTAPFPGQISEIKVKAGDTVAAGQVLLVISAMKMLTDVPADRPGKVLSVLVSSGQQVSEGVVMVRVQATGDAPAEPAAREELPRATRRLADGAGSPKALPGAWYAQGKAEAEPYATPVLRSKANPKDPAYQKRLAHNGALCAELGRRLALVRKGGGGRYEQLHRKRGKLLVRERVEGIIDKGTSFMELSALAGWGMYGGGVHSGGRCTGIGVVAGRECMFIGTDPTVKGGVIFPAGLKKELRAQEIAEVNHLPCIYLIDGGGAKLDSTAEKGSQKDVGDRDTSFEGELPANFVEVGVLFKNQARMSAKRIPQVAVVCGMCTAGGAYIPAMCDETIIVKDNGTVYLGGPPLVKAATGEDADEQSLGGAAMHTSKSGTCDHYANTEPEALAKCREVIEHLGGRRPRVTLSGCQAPEPPVYDAESLLGVIPESTNIPFDIREVIARVVDGSRFHEFKARYGPTLVCGWAHIEGYPVGILGNNGMLFSESALKGTQFIQICGQRGTPLLFLHNITGFIIGTEYEQRGITKDGAKMINAVTNVPVPKFSVVCAGSHGAGNYAMCGPAFDPRFTFLWPNAKICVMGGEQAAGVVAVVKQNQLKREGKPPLTPEQEQRLKKPIIDGMESANSAWHSTAGVYDDGIIDPRETRQVLARAISISLNAPFPDGPYGVFRM
eukprot:TRINITY_DN641_c0_g1_i2.p1 TRINITY_DN641_c0_g1~~TRINITY_DN641_c0_g1_i2.p1  ORF type:complete len:1189 (+),score=416.21 TRINITY_DN641_c0_g1_i2:87-3569(+)